MCKLSDTTKTLFLTSLRVFLEVFSRVIPDLCLSAINCRFRVSWINNNALFRKYIFLQNFERIFSRNFLGNFLKFRNIQINLTQYSPVSFSFPKSTNKWTKGRYQNEEIQGGVPAFDEKKSVHNCSEGGCVCFFYLFCVSLCIFTNE